MSHKIPWAKGLTNKCKCPQYHLDTLGLTRHSLSKFQANGKVYVLLILKEEEDIVRFWTWLIDHFAGAKTNQDFVLYCCPCAAVLRSRFQVVSGTELNLRSWFLREAGQAEKRRPCSVLSTSSTETRWCVYHVRWIVIYNDVASLTIQPSTDVHKIKLKRLKWKKKKDWVCLRV